MKIIDLARSIRSYIKIQISTKIDNFGRFAQKLILFYFGKESSRRILIVAQLCANKKQFFFSLKPVNLFANEYTFSIVLRI